MTIIVILASVLPVIFIPKKESGQFEFKALLSRQGQATFSILEKNQRLLLTDKGKIISYEALDARTISYDVFGKVESVDSENVIYNVEGQLTSLGPWKISYDMQNKIEAINDWRLEYDLYGRLIKFEMIEISYDFLTGSLTAVGDSKVSYNFLTGSICKIEKGASAVSPSIVFIDDPIQN
jgi:hypothetical protein